MWLQKITPLNELQIVSKEDRRSMRFRWQQRETVGLGWLILHPSLYHIGLPRAFSVSEA